MSVGTVGAGPRSLSFQRLLLWAALLLFAAWFLTPLYVMVVTSLKDMNQVRNGSLMSLPSDPTFGSWIKAWDHACTGVDCRGLRPFFMNSVYLVVPAVSISTFIGSVNGYVLTKWRFRGSETMFAMLLFGVFMPMQVVLLPMSQVLGWLGIASSLWGLILVHILAGIPSTTLFFRNYYVGVPDELVKAAMLDGASFWKIFTAHHAAAFDADPRRHADLAIHEHLERLPLRGRLQRRVQQADHRRTQQPVEHDELGQGIQRRHGGGADRGAADADRLRRRRQVFRPRADRGRGEGVNSWGH